MRHPYLKVHPRFKLNGFSVSFKELNEVGYNLIKEGEPHEQIVGHFLLDWIDYSPILRIRTSGSTGRPKLISLEKQLMINSALATGAFFDLKPGDSALLCLSAAYIAGKMMLVRAMVLGLELDLVQPASNPLLGSNTTYDFCAMVPLQLEAALKQINQIKKLIVGGAPISKKLREKVQQTRAQVFETYGMTETITHIAVRKLEQTVCSSSVENSFTLLPGITIEKDERDCLIINAPDVNPETIVTNDIVRIISDTQFEWLGRYDNIINSGGVKIIPERIEGKLESVIDNRFFIAGMPDEKLGQKIVLILEGEVDKVAFLKKLKSMKEFEKYEVPKEIVCVTDFIETENGKINRIKTIIYS
ncbi:MAG: AMP-binding protein [Maribacter sp.]|nr:AMP-binding protein [Maribacter sp.]